jgi:hypothetical protein
MTGEDFDTLVADIEKHGLLEPIDLLDDMVLDGRNRELACRKLGVCPQYVAYVSNQDPAAYVWSKNAERRHLSPGQRAECKRRRENPSLKRPGCPVAPE